MEHNIGKIVSIITLMLTLIGSWGIFYSEQQVNKLTIANNTSEIRRLEADNKSFVRAISNLNVNQAKLVETVSNNSRTTDELKADVRQMLNLLTENKMIMNKIAGQVGLK